MENKPVEFTVDDKKLTANEGESLLQTCLDNEIYIPNLCYLKTMNKPPASCRLCFVEIEGEERPVMSCTTKVREGMIVKTDTDRVRDLQRSGLKLLLSVHNVDCGNCQANKKCEIQNLAKFLKTGLKPKGLDIHLKEPELVDTHPFITYYPNRCVLCGRCVYTCSIKNHQPSITFAKRGLDTIISLDPVKNQPDSSCDQCLACVEICPVGALILKSQV